MQSRPWEALISSSKDTCVLVVSGLLPLVSQQGPSEEHQHGQLLLDHPWRASACLPLSRSCRGPPSAAPAASSLPEHAELIVLAYFPSPRMLLMFFFGLSHKSHLLKKAFIDPYCKVIATIKTFHHCVLWLSEFFHYLHCPLHLPLYSISA